MKPRWSLCSSAALCAITLVPIARAQVDAPAPSPSLADAVPEGLIASDWSSIRAAYEAGRHAAHAVEGGYDARNPGQGWRTRFDGRGFSTQPDAGGWTWGLELESYGFVGNERVVTSPLRVSAEGGRVEYDWDDTLTEWYVNDTRGLEHGYTVHLRPPRTNAEGGPLTFTLALRGALRAQVQDGGRGVRFSNDDGAAVLRYTGLSVLDADGQSLPARFEQVTEGLRLTIEERGARYPLTIDPLAQQAYLKASNSEALDGFGRSVSISGDTVVVGAVTENSNATGVDGDGGNNGSAQSGAAYVFVRSGTSWSQQAYLKASNTDAGDHFGRSVSVSDDTVVVGAFGEDSNATGVDGDQADNSASDSGAAYVFVRSGTSWSQQAYLKVSNGEIDDYLGISVSVSGDTVVVAAAWEDSNATGVDGDQADNHAFDSGAVYVFVRSGTSWSQQAYLKASNTETDDLFGRSVSVWGDTVVVAAPREDSNASGVNGDQVDNSASDSGAVYVFVRSGTSWSQQAYLKASNTETGDLFGSSVSVSGDTVLVGAEGEDSDATDVDGDQADNSALGTGAAYVFWELPDRFCDASDGSLASCPCSNPGDPDSGCENAQSTGGVSLSVLAQTTSPNGATLSGTGFSSMGAPTALVIRSNALDPSSPVVFGDGLRCINTSGLVRLAATTATGGVSTHTFGHGAMADSGTFYYQLWYRNTPSSYCTPAAFNLSSGRTLVW